jgi:hypothetical protein
MVVMVVRVETMLDVVEVEQEVQVLVVELSCNQGT